MTLLAHSGRGSIVALALGALLLALLGIGAQPASPARAETTYSISGTVSLPAGAPQPWLQGIRVRAEQDGSFIADAGVDSSTGAYTISGLVSGTYDVIAVVSPFDPGSGQPWEQPNLVSISYPSGVTVAAASASGIDIAVPLGRTLSGTVGLPDGSPQSWLRGVSVEAYRDGLAVSAEVDPSTGAFTIVGLSTGSYTVASDVREFFDDATQTTVRPNLVGKAYPSHVAVSNTDVTGLAISLVIGGIVSGTVAQIPGDSGFVNAYDDSGMPVGLSDMGPGGSFDIVGLDTGAVHLGVSFDQLVSGQHTNLFEFLRSGRSFSFGVQAGQTTAVSLSAAPTSSTISGSLTTYGFSGISTAAPKYQGYLAGENLYQKLDDVWVQVPTWNGYVESSANGTVQYSATLLAAGTYTVEFGQWWGPYPHYSGSGPVASQFWNAKTSLATADQIVLGAGQTVSGVCGSVHPASVAFADVPSDYQFFSQISWMAAQGITTGYDAACGLREFRPWGNVTRDAMAAFLYRFKGSPAFTPPAQSPFVDVTPASPFYKEITWLAQQGITTGWVTPAGKAYRPGSPITRDAMAAFLFRFAGSPTSYSPPAASPFIDVATSNPFYTQIAWMKDNGISGGWSTASGLEYRPYSNITRDAMAAFLNRYSTNIQ